jgi:spoIIIJ-associated protein
MFENDPNLDEWLDIEGRSKDDALERACNALNTTLPYLEYEVIGGNGSKIRARKLENPRTIEPRPVMPEAHDRFEEPPRREPHREARPEENRHPRRDRPRGPRHETQRAAPQEIEQDRGFEGEAEERVSETFLEEPSETGAAAKELLGEVLKHIDDAAEVGLKETTEEIRLEILGNGSGLFIGKRGATLEALQHLVAKMMGLDRRSGKRVTVDSEHYRQRRQEALEGLARKLASRARRERRPISVEPMNAIDRRILHLALKNDRSVTTKSVGEGSNRKVVVVPRNYGGDVEAQAGDSRGDQRRTRGGRGRPHPEGDQGRRPSGRRGAAPRAGKTRVIPPGRMHDSFDVPSVPEDLFENDEDLLTFEEQNEGGSLQGEPLSEESGPAPEASEDEER